MSVSPIQAFVDTLTLIARNRKMLAGVGDSLAAGSLATRNGWQTFTEDVEMMLHERVIIGLRHVWIRRVAVPVVSACRALEGHKIGPESQPTALKAIEILQQCTDEHVKMLCVDWIKQAYGVTAQ